jgi:eukaryotic-like serine/threonine-protein kinase
MDRDVIALFRELADCSPAAREDYYVRQRVPAALRAEVESLLRFDGETVEAVQGRVAAVAAHVLREDNEPLTAAGVGEDRSAVARPVLANGAVFGPYRIVRPLGRGGMGVVYEADEIESGRRVALKVLAALPQNSRERERFEREGRLAASVNHPHCVFVFGAGEIDGHPVIAMEVMQGTLADRLKKDGPFAPSAAVDAMLQLVAGLNVAAATGILHRDVKPSNCFVDAQGVVKIGDFGISRSQRPTEETAFSTRGHVPATPAYASPEQLRGAALDVRADIYSLGVTLYELLTGRRPFEGADLMALLMAVANDTPTAPRVIAPAIPKGLSAVVLHCLAKQPEQRFSDYDALAAALEPYSSTAPTTGTLGRRCVAGVIDSLPIVLATIPVSLWWGVDWLTIPPLLAVAVLEFLYFAICESVWAATPGKAICGLMIVQQGGTPARVWHVIVRAIGYVMLPAIPVFALMLVSPAVADSQRAVVAIVRVTLPPRPVGRLMATPESLLMVTSAVNGLMLLVLFSTMRRRNGYAGLHDLVSGTRIVERRVRASRWTAPPVPAAAPRDVVARLGSFAVLGGAVQGMPDGWRPGFDERLQRPIWIREVPPGTPPISVARRGINRATRLRWLAGRRDGEEAWDAFEAVQGVPLDSAVSRPRSWEHARWWLLDLARECGAQSLEDQPPRRRDRVWVPDAGGAKLIDDPAADQLVAASAADTPVAPFLLDIARAARESVQTDPHPSRTPTVPPWPVRVHQLLERFTAEPNLAASSIADMFEGLMRQRSAVTRGWRALSLVVPLLLPVLWASAALMMMWYVAYGVAHIPADVRIAARLLRALDRDARGVTTLAAQDREAIEAALVTRYRAGLTDERLFGDGSIFLGMNPSMRGRARDLLLRPPADAGETDRPANAAVATLVQQATDPERRTPLWLPVAIALVLLLMGLFSVAVVALADALVCRGGVMRLLGLELVTTNGRPASRRRVFFRTALAWAPVVLLALIAIWGIGTGEISARVNVPLSAEADRAVDPNLSVSLPRETGSRVGSSLRNSGVTALLLWLTPPCLLVLLVGATLAIVNPARGIPDRLAGTWIVPR